MFSTPGPGRASTNSGRWVQWRYQAVKPHGDAQSDLWDANRLGLELKKLYKDDPKAVCPDPIVRLNWNYGADSRRPPGGQGDQRLHRGPTRTRLATFLGLKDDGSTAGGCSIYSGSYPGPDKQGQQGCGPTGHERRVHRHRGIYPGMGLVPGP